MTDTPNRPPLWREIDDAWWSLVDTGDLHAAPPESDQAACVIRAVRDWLVPFSLSPGGHRPDPDYEHCEWAHAQRLRALLTAEADRAERGEVEHG